MVASDLVVGACVGGPNVEAFARKSATLRIDAERDPDESAGIARRVGEHSANDIHLDRAVVEVETGHIREGVHVGTSVRPLQTHFESVAAAVANRLHAHVARAHLRRVVQRIFVAWARIANRGHGTTQQRQQRDGFGDKISLRP